MITRLLLSIAMALSAAAAQAASTSSGLSVEIVPAIQGQAFYVDPNGNDSNPGTPSQPWKTAARATQATQAAGAAVTVVFNAGTYPVSSPLGLSGDLHGSTWTAAAGAKPVLSGGTQITGWSLHDAGNNIWQAPVPPGLDFREFYVNGHAALRARGLYGQYTFTSTGFTDPTGGVQNLSDLPDVEIENINGWQYGACQVTSVSGLSITMNSTCWPLYTATMAWGNNNLSGHWTNWAENAYELLAASGPGSFYLQKSTNTVYYIPNSGENMNTAVGTAPVLTQFISGNLSNITFSHLTFAYTSWLGPQQNNRGYIATEAGQTRDPYDGNYVPPAAFDFAVGTNVAFDHNLFMGLSGTYALHFGWGSNNNQITANQFDENAGGAIAFGNGGTGSGGEPTAYSYNNPIQNNDIIAATHQSGYYDAPGILMNETINSNVTHNHIASFFWGTAQFVNSQTQNTNNFFTHNLAENNCSQLFDCGGIYSTGYHTGTADPTSPKFTVSNNYFHNIGRAGYWTSCFYADSGTWEALYQNNVCDNPALSNFLFYNGTPDGYSMNSGSNTVTGNYATTLAVDSYFAESGNDLSNNTQFASGSPPPAAQAIIANAGIQPGTSPGP